MTPNQPYQYYTAADIQRYLLGNMTVDEMHALEKAALDDPLLAEAMEGYETAPAGWEAQLANLHQQFQAQTNAVAPVVAMKPTPAFRWWKVAAAALILVTGGTLIYQALVPSGKSNSPAIANIKTEQQHTPPIPSDQAPTIASADPTNPSSPNNSPAKDGPFTSNPDQVSNLDTLRNGSVANDDAKQMSSADSAFIYRPSEPVVSTNQAGVMPANVERGRAESQMETVASNNGYLNRQQNNTVNNAVNFDQEKAADKKESARKPQPGFNQVFNARVLGSDLTPLAFANVSVVDESVGTYADVKGNFKLISTDSIVKVEIKSEGYEPQIVALKSGKSINQIVMKESMANRVDMGKRKWSAVAKKSYLKADSLVTAEPADGWNNYNTYLANNIQFSDELRKQNIHGEVELSFEVQPNGTIANVKVNKSLCSACDEEAIRLLKQGPQWKLKKGTRGKASIKVAF